MPLFGLIFVSLKCKSDNVKANFYRSFNSIFSKVGRAASSQLILHLTQAKRVPSLLFGLDACPIYSADYESLERPLTASCSLVLRHIKQTILTRKINFRTKHSAERKTKYAHILILSAKCDLQQLCATIINK